jgi:Icc protein
VAPNSFDTPVLRIAQITDTHLYADPNGKLLGLNTRHCLQQVVALAADRQPQLVIATGDLTHDGSPAAYRQLRACFDPLQVSVYCLPGNHDEAGSLRHCLGDASYHSISSVQINGWQLAFVDSTVQGSDGGHLSIRELARLDETLAQAPQLPAIVWLHHQPVLIGSRWLDSMAVDNADDFFQIIDRYPQVRAVVWGHVHQCFEHRHRNIPLLASPSTCIQFLPNSAEFAIDEIPPGYRWFDLYSDGRFTSGVERLAAIPGAIDWNADGY